MVKFVIGAIIFGLAVIIAWYVILSVATNKTTTKPE